MTDPVPAASAAASSTTTDSAYVALSSLSVLWLDRLIVLAALICIGIIIFRVSKVLLSIHDEVDLEVRKIRFASVTFAGIMVLLVFVALLYFLDRPGSTAGQVIFEKTLTSLTPLAGAIIGYLFGGRTGKTRTSAEAPWHELPTDPRPIRDPSEPATPFESAQGER